MSFFLNSAVLNILVQTPFSFGSLWFRLPGQGYQVKWSEQLWSSCHMCFRLFSGKTEFTVAQIFSPYCMWDCPSRQWGNTQGGGLLSGGIGEEGHHGHLRLKNACFPWLAVSKWKLEFEMSSECHHMPLRPSNGVSVYEESSFSPSLAEIFTSKVDLGRLRFCLFFLVRSQIMKMLLIRKDKYIRQVQGLLSDLLEPDHQWSSKFWLHLCRELTLLSFILASFQFG